jgi:hypothetical protein
MGKPLDYEDYDFWYYEFDKVGFPAIQVVYSVYENKAIIEFLNIVYPE